MSVNMPRVYRARARYRLAAVEHRTADLVNSPITRELPRSACELSRWENVKIQSSLAHARGRSMAVCGLKVAGSVSREI